MDNILISILITAYNCENFIENAIKSAINQTYKNIEILISDDCSTDSTLKVIQKYAAIDKRIHFFTSNKNRSIGYWRNFLISQVKGQYFTFLDGDDFLNVRFIEKLSNPIFKKRTHFDLISCKSVCIWLNKFNKKFFRVPFLINYFPLFGRVDNIKFVNKTLCVLLWGNLFNIDFFRSLNIYFMPFKKYEDVGNTLYIFLKAHKFAFVRFNGYNYVRRKSGNLSNIKETNLTSITDLVWQIDHLLKILDENNMLSDPIYQKSISRFVIPIGFLLSILTANVFKPKCDHKTKLLLLRERMRFIYLIICKYKLNTKISVTWWKAILKNFNKISFNKEFATIENLYSL